MFDPSWNSAMQQMGFGNNEPHTCTKDDPWTKEKSDRAVHLDAVYVSDRDYGGGEYCEKYRCPNCGLTFEVELPQ